MKRSKQWAVIRNEAPVMAWEDPDRLRDFHPVLASVLDRFAAAHGSAPIARFYDRLIELGGRIYDAGDTPENPIDDDDAMQIIRDYFAEIRELDGPEAAATFAQFYRAIIGFLTRVEKGAIARAAVRRQLRRVARR